MKKCILFFSLIILMGCMPNQKPRSQKEINDSTMLADSFAMVKAFNDSIEHVKQVSDSVADANKTDWNFSEDKDEMTGSITKFAMNASSELLFFDSPYDGGSTLTMTVRKRRGNTDVMLQISSGQFLTNDQICRLKFDDGKPITVSISEPSDYSSDVVFLGSAGLIISKLKKAEKLLVEISFYDEGSRQVHYNVKGFKWD